MKDKKDIFDSMKDKLNNNNFEFNKAHWDQMEKMLDDDPKPVGFFRFKNIGRIAVFSLLFLGSILLFNSLSHKKSKQKLTSSPTENINSKENEDLKKDEVKFVIKQNQNEGKLIDNLKVTELNDTSNHFNNLLEKLPNKETISNLSEINTNNRNGISPKANVHSKEKSIQDNIISPKNDNKIEVPLTQTIISNLHSEIINKSYIQNDDLKSELNKSIIDADLKKPNTDLQKNDNQNIIKNPEQNNTKELLIDDIVYNYLDQIVKMETDSSIILEDSIKLVANIDSILSNDSLELDSTFLYKELFLVGGINLYQGYLNTEATRNYSKDPNFGIIYKKDIKSKLGIIIGLNYFSKSKINSKKEYQYITYDFGKNEENITIQTNKLHFVNLIVGSYYKINPKFDITAMFSGNKLINTNDILTKETISTLNGASISSSKEHNLSNGFKDYSFDFILGIQYNMTNKFSTSLNYNFGLTDITKNDYFENLIKDYNRGLQIKLLYKLAQKQKVLK